MPISLSYQVRVILLHYFYFCLDPNQAHRGPTHKPLTIKSNPNPTIILNPIHYIHFLTNNPILIITNKSYIIHILIKPNLLFLLSSQTPAESFLQPQTTAETPLHTHAPPPRPRRHTPENCRSPNLLTHHLIGRA